MNSDAEADPSASDRGCYQKYKRWNMKVRSAVLSMSIALVSAPAFADIVVCGTVSATGAAASLGIPARNTIKFLPKEVSGLAIRYTVYDDNTDPNVASQNARRCVEEQKADVLFGSSTTPGSAAVASVAAETRTPLVTIAPMNVSQEAYRWTFGTVQPATEMARAILQDFRAKGGKRLGFIGFSDSYGDLWINIVKKLQPEFPEIEIVGEERYARADTSVTGQALRIVSRRPDAVLVAAAATPAALPNIALRERGFKGQIYHTYGSATNDFIRVGAASAEGTLLSAGPVMVAPSLPANHPSRPLAVSYFEAYEAENGKGSVTSQGGYMFDAGQLIAAAAPAALQKAKPGTPEFRAGMRDALEGLKNIVLVHGVWSASPEVHEGHGSESRVMISVKDGRWVGAN